MALVRHVTGVKLASTSAQTTRMAGLAPLINPLLTQISAGLAKATGQGKSMRKPELKLHRDTLAPEASGRARPIGRHLIDAGLLTSEQLLNALQLQVRFQAPLGEILVSEGLVEERHVLDVVAAQHGVHVVDLKTEPPDASLTALMPAEFWLCHRVIPWIGLGRTLVLATARPDLLDEVRAAMPDPEQRLLCVVAPEAQIMAALAHRFSAHLANRAEHRVADAFSFRARPARSHHPGLGKVAVLAVLAGGAITAPMLALQAISGLAILTLVLVAALKIAALVTQVTASLHRPRPPIAVQGGNRLKLPKVSVIVPLFHETEIAGALVRRLSRLSYPKALLEVVLVLEERDEVTRHALERTELPTWMRVLEVPDNGGVTTKPRALNYALDFCRGDIIGVWDAEDAPAPDQIEQAVSRFAEAPGDVACLQGILDFYNPRSNWISRCFTIEYASWWRVLLPGIARMGLVIPLGGTTLFFRRAALEELGGWDAHNVTEDADLGVRLARFGYRTELIDTVTHEEANCRVWPWIRQRSRWLKGFMVTWLVHMRRPRQLLRDLGWRRFLGFQAFFAGTVAQFLLAPLLWSFWALPLGFSHPLLPVLGASVLWALGLLLIVVEISNALIGLIAVSGRDHRFLALWVPSLTLYFPMGALAACKALGELLHDPYFWDKTQHGHAAPDPDLPQG